MTGAGVHGVRVSSRGSEVPRVSAEVQDSFGRANPAGPKPRSLGMALPPSSYGASLLIATQDLAGRGLLGD